MLELPNTHPTLQRIFQNRFLTIRRSDKFWAGLSSGLAIEKTLMRSVKTSFVFTKGRGIDELQHSIWLLSTSVTSEMNQAMQEFIGVKYERFIIE